jgi:hypothetical protein
MLLLILSACADPEDSGARTFGAGDESDADTDADADGDADTDAPEQSESYALVGELTWTMNAAGCSFTKTYEAVEDRSAPWLCPGCATQALAQGLSTDGVECYEQVYEDKSPAVAERLGLGTATALYWTDQTNHPLGRLGTAEGTDHLVVDGESGAGVKPTFTVAGALERVSTDADPWHGFTPPATYACGWSKADPPPYEGNWALELGSTIPDGWFLDRCNEPVRLHDFAGQYLVIEYSAVDCPPCAVMASEADAFEASMAAEGIPTRVVTLLISTKYDPFRETTWEEIDTWSSTYGESGPVLADRGWGWSVVASYLGSAPYPTWLIVGPDLRFLEVGMGYASGHYDTTIAPKIRAHAE